jgi:hypothetical protein
MKYAVLCASAENETCNNTSENNVFNIKLLDNLINR